MERNNLWAPWRIQYIKSLTNQSGCFMCQYYQTQARDEQNFVLWRTERSIVMFNRFPYNNGHLLIAPARHIADLAEANDDELLELTRLTRDCQEVLTEAIAPHGFNVGMNFGRCAGAGLPGHLHIHVVPRWDGDTNYMHVCSNNDVISQSIRELYQILKQISAEKKLPNL